MVLLSLLCKGCLKAVTCDMDLIQVPLDSGSSGSGRQKVSADLESPKGRPRWVETVTPFKYIYIIYICVCAGFLTTAQNDTTSYNGTWDLITHVNQNMFINFIHTIYYLYMSLWGVSSILSTCIYLSYDVICIYLYIYIHTHTWIFQVFLRPASNHRGKTYHIISDFRKRS